MNALMEVKYFFSNQAINLGPREVYCFYHTTEIINKINFIHLRKRPARTEGCLVRDVRDRFEVLVSFFHTETIRVFRDRPV